MIVTMVTKHELPAGAFKARCLKVMDDVQRTRAEVVITKRGTPVAKLVPVDDAPASPVGCMKGTAEIRGDLVAPVTGLDDWKATR